MADSNAADNRGLQQRGERPLNPLRLSPEIQVELPGLDEIEVVVVVVNEPEPRWFRWTEGVTVHLVANGVVAFIAFLAGRFSPF